MRILRRLARLALLSLAMMAVMSGCGHLDRSAIYSQLDARPMTPQAYAQCRGTFEGPVRATSMRGGFEGEASIEMRLDLAGTPDAPLVKLRTDRQYSTGWALYGEREGTYTNIPSERYGSQGMVYASTHAPNQVWLRLRRFGPSTGSSVSLILSFHENGVIDVEWIGHAGWRGEGELWRVPAVMRHF